LFHGLSTIAENAWANIGIMFEAITDTEYYSLAGLL